MTHRPNIFASGNPDRASHLRKDEIWLAQQLDSTETRFIPIWRQKNFFPEHGDPQPLVLRNFEIKDAALESGQLIFLGQDCQSAFFAIDVSHCDMPDTLFSFEEKPVVDELKKWGAVLSNEQASLLAYARGMAYWHRRYQFCGACGAKTISLEAGHLRRCVNPECKAQYFPRTDPAIIVLVTSGEKCLLGRQANWVEGVYSTLAGFVEPGESLENAVEREIYEEAGIIVDKITYHSSQPWPFPSSIMLGFTAEAKNEKISFNDNELEDARWFTRAELREQSEAGIVRLPSPVSIARRLVEEWLEGNA